MWGGGSLDVIVILTLPTDPWANRDVAHSFVIVPPLHVECSSSEPLHPPRDLQKQKTTTMRMNSKNH
jgi:hypothetical protein